MQMLAVSLDVTAVTAAVATFVVVQRALKALCVAKPQGSLLYYCDSTCIRPDAARWERRGVVQAIVGHFWDVALSPCGEAYQRYLDAARRARNSNAAVAVCRVGPELQVLVGSPRDAKYILVDNEKAFVKSRFVDFIKPVLGDTGLITLTDRIQHAMHRRAVAPAFTPTMVRQLSAKVTAPCFFEMVQQLQASVGEGGLQPVDLALTFDGVALKIISQATFASDAFEVILPLIHDMKIEPSVWMAFGPAVYNCLPTALSRQFKRFRRVMASLTENVLSSRRVSKDHGDGEGDDAVPKMLVDVLLEQALFSKQDVHNHAATIIFAGHDTTASAMTWFAYLMAKHPDIQHEVREELRGLLSMGASPSQTALAHARLLQACINEALRLFPPIPAMAREAAEDVVLPASGVWLPRGTPIVVPHHVLHRDEITWGPNASAFRPQRWMEDPDLKQRAFHDCSYIPFGAGPRSCIGKDFAELELLLGCAALLRNFELLWPAAQPDPVPLVGVVVKPNSSFHIVLNRVVQ